MDGHTVTISSDLWSQMLKISLRLDSKHFSLIQHLNLENQSLFKPGFFSPQSILLNGLPVTLSSQSLEAFIYYVSLTSCPVSQSFK